MPEVHAHTYGMPCPMSGCRWPVRTQAERDADRQAWRPGDDMITALSRAARLIADQPPPVTCLRMHPAAYRLMAARASAAPPPHLGAPPAGLLGLPVIEDTELPFGAWHLLDGEGRVVKRGQFRLPWPDPEFGASPRPPRRRWWHRLTRRNP